jgi:hypothetical protein
VTVTGLDDTDRLACAAVPVEDPLDVHGVAVAALDGEHRVGDRRDLPSPGQHRVLFNC